MYYTIKIEKNQVNSIVTDKNKVKKEKIKKKKIKNITQISVEIEKIKKSIKIQKKESHYWLSMVQQEEFESPTSRFVAECSIQLSYCCKCIKTKNVLVNF